MKSLIKYIVIFFLGGLSFILKPTEDEFKKDFTAVYTERYGEKGVEASKHFVVFDVGAVLFMSGYLENKTEKKMVGLSVFGANVIFTNNSLN